MINSCIKGKVGEREWRDVLIEHGYTDARRGQQYAGSPESPDVACESLPIHWEVKRVEHLNLEKAMQQAIEDCGGKSPMVAHRKNSGEWLVTMRAEDFFKILPDV